MPTTAMAAPPVSTGSGLNVVPAAGQIKATLLASSSHPGKAKAVPALPAKFMHPHELELAKIKASAGFSSGAFTTGQDPLAMVCQPARSDPSLTDRVRRRVRTSPSRDVTGNFRQPTL